MKKNTVALAVAAAMTASLLVAAAVPQLTAHPRQNPLQHLRMLPLLQPPLPMAMRP